MQNESNLVESLQKIVELCGYYALTPGETDTLIRYINKNYLELTGGKLEEIFELAVMGQLNIELKAKLSAKELTRVILAWKGMFEKRQASEEPAGPTDEEKDKIHKEWMEKCVFVGINNFFKTGDYKVRDAGNPLYNYLDRAGLISFSKEVEEKFRLQIASNTKIDSSTEIRPIKMIIDQSDYLTKKNYKHYALEQFLRSCKQEKRDIIGEIKSYEQKVEYEKSIS